MNEDVAQHFVILYYSRDGSYWCYCETRPIFNLVDTRSIIASSQLDARLGLFTNSDSVILYPWPGTIHYKVPASG